MNRKLKLTTVATIAILSILIGPMFFVPTAAQGTWADPTAWYETVSGVLDTDYYTLYPYGNDSLKLGFSKFGELIDSNTNVGLEYAGERDPFAPPAGPGEVWPVPKHVWINGWLLNITYNHISWGLAPRRRNVWASALFADLEEYGGPWIRVDNNYWTPVGSEADEDPRVTGLELDANGNVVGTTLVNGGRKTNGTATTDPIEVLYNGPRRYVAKLVTHVYDVYEPTMTKLHLVDLVFTIIFNKVKKEVIVLKDVKMAPMAKFTGTGSLRLYQDGTLFTVPRGLLVQFSNREQWDLGDPEAVEPYTSYVHFYVDDLGEGYGTKYGSDWHAFRTIPDDVRLSLTEPYLCSGALEPDDSPGDTADVAQIISNDLEYVGWAAYWPSLSDWEVDAGREDIWWRSLTTDDLHNTDTLDEPFLAPLTVGEWDFILSDAHREGLGPDLNIWADVQFRGVTVFGVTDLNDGFDENITHGIPDEIDSEVYYQLNEVFNPWDLRDVLENKDTQRWVNKYYGDELIGIDGVDLDDLWLRYADMWPARAIIGWPYVRIADFAMGPAWGAYCNFTERVLVDGVLQVRDVDYTIENNGTYVFIEFLTVPEEESLIKILFSTWSEAMSPFHGTWEWLIVGRDSAAVDSAGASMVSEFFSTLIGTPVKMSGLDMQDVLWGPETPWVMEEMRPGVGTVQVRPDPAALQPSRDCYRDDTFGPCHGRSRLLDDWSCHYNATAEEWYNGLPISSSNIITIGSSYANHATEYFNEFTDAYLDVGTGESLYPGKIVSLTCWNKNTYKPTYDAAGNQLTGYAVYATYKDLNGTVGLAIWGWTGQDTYYATWSLLHSEILWIGMASMPPGVTAVVVEFDYTLHPTDYCFVTIAEILGTISELDAVRCFGDVGPDFGLPETWVTDKFPTIHPDPEE